jgi:hypothetical protein
MQKSMQGHQEIKYVTISKECQITGKKSECSYLNKDMFYNLTSTVSFMLEDFKVLFIIIKLAISAVIHTTSAFKTINNQTTKMMMN